MISQTLSLLFYPAQSFLRSEELVFDLVSKKLFVRISEDKEEEEECISFFELTQQEAQEDILCFGNQSDRQKANCYSAGLLPAGDRIAIIGKQQPPEDYPDDCPWAFANIFQVTIEGSPGSPYWFDDINQALEFASGVALELANK